MDNQTAAAATKNYTHMSGISLPPFTGSSVGQWLKLCTLAFNAYAVTDVDQKCYLLLSALPPNLQSDLTNIMVDNPNVEEKFELLRDNLIKLTDVPESTRIKSLLNHTPMGDRTPSEYLRHLRHVAGTSQDKDSPLLRSIFLERIPSFMRAIIAHMTDQSLDYLAETADKIHLAIGSEASLNHLPSKLDPSAPSFYDSRLQPQQLASSPLPTSDLATSIHSLQLDVKTQLAQTQAAQDSVRELAKTLNTLTHNFTAAVAQLQQQITTLQLQVSDNSARNNGYRARSPSRPRINNSGMCYYHAKFGKNAMRCDKPCSWVSESRTNDSGN